MTVRKALFIHGSAGTPNYPAEEVRAMYTAAFGGDLYTAVSPGIGAIARSHGVLKGGLAVTPNGTPNLTVHVASGLALIRGTQENDQGAYVFGNDADVTLTITPDASNPRNVLVLAKVRDAQYPAHTGDDAILEALHGTPAGSPVDPTVPEDALVLARVRVGANDTAITSGEIDDLRPEVTATGGITPVNALADWPSPREGDVLYRKDVDRLAVYTGSAWRHHSLDYTDRGQASASFSSQQVVSVTVNFNVTFVSTPTIVACARGTTTNANVVVNTDGTTSFVARVDAGAVISGTITVPWIAIGQLA